MNELIKVNYDTDMPTVSGRELHAALEVETPYHKWFPRKMNTKISIVQTDIHKDGQGFKQPTDVVLATVRAYREGRHGSERWANLATFSEATDLFRFRVIPHIKVMTDHTIICGDERFEITSVENVKGRNMYIEVLGKKQEPSK